MINIIGKVINKYFNTIKVISFIVIFRNSKYLFLKKTFKIRYILDSRNEANINDIIYINNYKKTFKHKIYLIKLIKFK